ncbi:HEPN domain-containing protein [Candidatus Poribacteria bacterium]|nr:HEPN domain-containing protein [Candidatus Poribacteria bacterium]
MTTKNKQDHPLINEESIAVLVPGMLMSAKALIEFGSSEWKKEDPEALVPGTITSSIIISGHCAELLLKYKIKREGRTFKNTHDLYNLYRKLKMESKEKIQKEFDKLKSASEIALGEGWDSTEAIFQKARNASVNWRFVNKKSLTCDHRALYIAAVSVYKTTPFASKTYSRQEVKDPALKASVFGGLGRTTR